MCCILKIGLLVRFKDDELKIGLLVMMLYT